MVRFRIASAAVVLLPLVTGCGGCDSSQVVQQAKETANQVTQTVTDTVDKTQNQAKEQLGLVGSSELTLDAGGINTPAAPFKVPSCYATFTPPTGGREGVLSLRSYRDAEKETFPSYYLQASTPAATLAELAGQTIPAQMFIKASADGATWHTTPAAPVQLKIISIEKQQITAEVASGALAGTDGKTMNASGKFVGVLP